MDTMLFQNVIILNKLYSAYDSLTHAPKPYLNNVNYILFFQWKKKGENVKIA